MIVIAKFGHLKSMKFFVLKKKRGIIVLDFLLLWSWLNLLFFLLEKQQELANFGIFLKAVIL